MGETHEFANISVMTDAEEIIRAEIDASGPMRFDRFMELALYHPGAGYYASTPKLGRRGDFFTSVSVGPLFGRLLARQFFQMWHQLERPDPFWIIEQGAHDGQLVRDILEWCETEAPDFFRAIRYAVVQPQGQNLPALKEKFADHLSVFDTLNSLGTQQPIGVFFSNELVDAFPVRLVHYGLSEWQERHVYLNADTLDWTDLPIDDEALSTAITARALPAIEGYATEIHLRAQDWMRGVAGALHRGYVLTVDYGYPAPLYYAPFRTHGTLTAYANHRRSHDVLSEPGTRDITAHVDFTALAHTGTDAGLTMLGFLDQQHFLMGLAHDELSDRAGPRIGIAQNPGAWNTLTHPNHLGAVFHALLQAKGDVPPQIDGLRFTRQGGLE